MDLKLLHSYLKNYTDDEKLDIIPTIAKNYSKSDITDIILCFELFENEESVLTFLSLCIQYFKLSHRNDSYITIIDWFKLYRYNAFTTCYNNYIIPHDINAFYTLIELMNDESDILKISDYFSDIYINDHLSFCNFVSTIFISYNEFKKICEKLRIGRLFYENFQDYFVKKNYSIIINNVKLPYIKIDDKGLFMIDNKWYAIYNSFDKIQIYANNTLIVESFGIFHNIKIEN